MDYPSFEITADENRLGEDIYYYTDQEDYIRLEEFKNRKRKTSVVTLAMLACLTAATYYEFRKTQSGSVLGLYLACLFIIVLVSLYKRFSGADERVKKYYNSDYYYGAFKHARFYPDRVELSAFTPDKDKIAFRGVYPYSLMDAIVVTVDDYYFLVGGQSYVVPRRFIKEYGADTQLLDIFKASGKMMDDR